MTEQELRLLNCVSPDVPGFDKSDLRIKKSSRFHLQKKKIKKKYSEAPRHKSVNPRQVQVIHPHP